MIPTECKVATNAVRCVILFVFLLLAVPAAFIYYCVAMPGRSFKGPLPASSDLELAARLERHVRYLAETIGERHYQRTGSLKHAAAYIEERFEDTGYRVRHLTYVARDPHFFENLEVELPGTSTEHEIVVIGAHYDTVPGSPGADDNASSVAALIELARLLKEHRPQKTVRFVAFVNEEEPSATIYTMGSMVYARSARAKQECIVAMLSLESIGYYNDSPNSQHYPKPFNWFYPNTGNFLAFVGNLASRSLVRRTITSFRQHAQFPSEGVAAPEKYAPDIRRSDHSSFWQNGYAAIMVTGTAPFRNPHYHQHSDTPGTLRFDALARVVSGMSAVIIDLAGND